MSDDDNRLPLGELPPELVVLKEKLTQVAERIPKINLDPGIVQAIGQCGEIIRKVSVSLDGFLKSDFFSQFGEMLVRIKESNEIRAKKYPRISQNLEEIAFHGWFLSLQMDLATYESLAFSLDDIPEGDGRWQALDKIFHKHYSENIDYFLSEIIEKYPHREFAVKPAVSAHMRGEYALSVPVFFAQAEGILRDETEKELFTKKDNISNYALGQRLEVENPEEWHKYFDDAVWAPLCGNLPITWGPRDRQGAEYSGLNRNTALHGIDLNYATEINSLKSYSLLCYVAGLFDRQDKDRLS